jgi:peroxiredoxin
MSRSLIGPGDLCPDFSLPAVDNTIWQRKALLRDPGALLVFFRRQEPACRFALMAAERIFRRLSRSGWSIAGVSQDSHRDTLELADAFQITFPLLLDHPPCSLSAAFGVERVPTLVLLDAGGRVRETMLSFSRAALEDLYRRLGEAAGVPVTGLFTAGDLVPDLLEGGPGLGLDLPGERS